MNKNQGRRNTIRHHHYSKPRNKQSCTRKAKTNMFTYYAYMPPRQPPYQLISTSSQELQSNYANLIRRSHQYAVLINYANNIQTLSIDHINMQTHQQITSVLVNPDKQVDIIIVIYTQYINKYISRHPQIRVAKQHKQRAICTVVQQLIPTS